MGEINLLEKYPRSKRPIDERAAVKTEENVAIAKKFEKEYFDGPRTQGYGGYYYHERFWSEVVKDFIKYYNLTNESKILDVGCGKGFMLYDFRKALPGITVKGIDISQYGIANAIEDVKPFLQIGNAKDLKMFGDNEFDVVISINTIHNLELEECKKSLREIQRIGKNAFITVDAWRTDQEKESFIKWNLTALTYMHVEDWEKLFKEVGYNGDYHWFIAE